MVNHQPVVKVSHRATALDRHSGGRGLPSTPAAATHGLPDPARTLSSQLPTLPRLKIFRKNRDRHRRVNHPPRLAAPATLDCRSISHNPHVQLEESTTWRARDSPLAGTVRKDHLGDQRRVRGKIAHRVTTIGFRSDRDPSLNRGAFGCGHAPQYAHLRVRNRLPVICPSYDAHEPGRGVGGTYCGKERFQRRNVQICTRHRAAP